MKDFSRRGFLQGATVAGAAVGWGSAKVLGEAVAEVPAGAGFVWPENGTLIPDDGWRLWVDAEAKWQEDEIYLPEDVSKGADGAVTGKGQALPVNTPTGGWAVLGDASGIGVVLPTTVEQHFWAKYGAGVDGKPRPYTPEEYRYAAPASGGVAPADDDVPQNGAYFGVSWWWRKIEIPESMRGKRVFLHVRGARLRAEVYLNRRLVGYSIMEELPFECDMTHAMMPGGENLLAIRVTNPFGRFDWVDGSNAKWGKVALYQSHGFGGLDRGMTVSAHDPAVRIKDAWVLNTVAPKTITVHVDVESLISDPAYSVNAWVSDPQDAKSLGTGAGTQSGDIYSMRCGDSFDQKNRGVKGGKCITLPPQPSKGLSRVDLDIHLPSAQLWDLSTPKIYHLRIVTKTRSGKEDVRTIAFGFRWFGPEGLGKDAMFRLNGRRLRIYTAISWGFWGLNGLFPVPELAEKEVTQAKKLGLNCLNFHRNLAKEEVLRAHDRLGLLRYMEPGAGKLAIGKLPSGVETNAANIVMEKPVTEADRFAQRFMFVKCVEMVKAYRSHPSVIEYCLQNEIGADLKNPATLEVLAAMRAEDPSRCIVLNDGFVAKPRKAAQAWYAPYDDKIHRSDEEPWGGWWNQHQGAGDQWYDKFYEGPEKFTYRAPFKDVITEYGEMEGCARPDNHTLMVHQIEETYKRYGGTSYDLKDHEEIIAGYETFLDRWGFRNAFPTAESVFLAVGRTSYESWMNYMENARIAEDLDFAAISGWESTAIENHSGIVDNLRNFKSDPGLIAGSLLPVRPVAKQRALCVAMGSSAIFDLFLMNDTAVPATGTLTFAMVTPSGKRVVLKTLEAPKQTADVFSYLLAEGFETPKLVEEGLYRFKFGISSVPGATQTKEIWVTGVSQSTTEGCKALLVAVVGISTSLRKQLESVSERQGCFKIVDFKAGGSYKLIVTSGMTEKTGPEQAVGETTGVGAVPGAKVVVELGRLADGVLEAVKAGTSLLVMPQTDALSDGVAKQMAEAGAFKYSGAVGDFRAPWMGNWYFVREHALFAGMPVNQAMGGFYQVRGRPSNGVLAEGEGVEVVVGYSRDHDRKVGAGTLTTKLGKGKVVFHRVPEMHAVLQQRFLANALRWLTI